MTWQEAGDLIDRWEQAVVIASASPHDWVNQCRLQLKILLKVALTNPEGLEKIMREDMNGKL